MAEELDEFGIPIRRSQSAPVDSGGDVDEFGIPIKKKSGIKAAPSSSVTSGGKSSFQYSNPLTTEQPDNSFSIQPEELRQSKINDPNFDVTLSLGNKKKNTLSPNVNNQGTFSEAITDNLSGRRTDNTTRALQTAVSAYDAAQGAGSSMENVTNANMIADDRKELGAMESVGNSFSNMVNRIKGAIPRLNIVAADVLENSIGKELTNSWYQLEGRDVDEVRNTAYADLDELEKTVKPTLGTFNAIQNGSVKDFAASFVNAVTSLGSTAVPSLLTGGAGVFTEMMGDSIVDFNNIKAKRLGLSVDELYSSGQADFAIPATLGAVAGGMELVGLKGVENLLKGKIAGTGMRKAALFLGESQKEGLTEWLQDGLTAANNSLAEGKSVSDASKSAVDTMFSKQGLESYLQGTIASVGAGGLGHVYDSVKSQKAKTSIAQDISNIGMAELDLQNPAVSDQSKAVIAGQMNQAVSNIADAVENDFETMDKLSPAQNRQITETQSQIDNLRTVVEDPAVTTQTKSIAESQIAPLESQIEEIINTKPEKETETISGFTPERLNDDTYTDKYGEQFKINIFDGPNGEVSNVDDIQNKDRLSLVVTNNSGESVGRLSFWKDEDGKFFSNLTDVSPKFRRKGIASAMYQFAKNNGYDIKSSEIQTEKGNSFANNFFNETKEYKEDENQQSLPAEQITETEEVIQEPTVPQQESKKVTESINKETLYHGSPVSGLQSITSENAGGNTNVESARNGIWVTNNKDVAETFRDWKNPIEKGKTGEIYDVKVDIKNPLYTEDVNEKGRVAAIKKASEQGNDSVVFTDEKGNRQIFVFDAKQVALQSKKIERPKSYGYEDIDAMVNEKEVADNLQQEIESPTELTPVQQSIRDAGGFTTTPESYARYGDKNNQGDQMAKSYFNKQGLPLDKIAQSLSKDGLEVTPADLVEYMDQFPDGNTTYSGRAKALQEKLFDMTGKKYNKFTVKKFRDRLEAEAQRRLESEPAKVNQESVDLINEEGLTSDNIDDNQDYIEFLFDNETFENIKSYLNARKQENTTAQVDKKTDDSGSGSRRVEKQTSKSEKASETTKPTKPDKAEVNSKEPVEEVPKEKAGDPLRSFAEKVRAGKINKLGGFKAATGFDGAWDLSLEAIALSLEGGAKVADAIDAGLTAIRKTDWYKNLGEKEDFDAKFTEHMNNEYTNEEKASQKSSLNPDEASGNRLEDTAKTREEMGFDEYERVSKSDIKLNEQADAAIADGSIKVNDILKRIEKGEATTDVEQVILRKYIVSLEASIAKSPNAESIAELKRAIDLSDQSGTAAGRALAARQGSLIREDNLANFLMDEMAADGLNSFTQEEIDGLKKKWEVGEEAKRKYEEGYAKALDDMMKKKAEEVLKKEQAKAKAKPRTSKPSVKKTHTEYVSERQKLKDSIREKLRKSRGQLNATVPYLNELIAISPDVARLVKSYVEEGVSKLDDIVKAIHSDLKDDIEGIQEEDVIDLIAGNYSQAKQTKNSIQEQVVDLKTQAKLLAKIEKLERGMETATSKVKRQRSIEVQKLLDRVKELEAKNADEVVVDPDAKEASRLKAKNTWLKNQIAKMQKDIEEGNFEEPVAPTPIKLDAETQKYQDEYIAFLKETNMRRDQARYERQSKYVKAWDKFQQITGLRRLVQTSIDFSMPFRQGITVTLNPRHAKVTAKAFGEMFKGAFSVKKYDRMMFAIQQSDLYRDMVADGVKFNEVDSVDNLNRNEDYRTSFIYKIPILREPLLASERAAAGFINTARFELYTKMARNLEAQGITRQSDPKSYKEAAKWVNNMTGRGNLLTFIEESNQGQRIAGNTFFGARLMASRFNLLNPVYYKRMPKEVRVQALADMGAFTSMVVLAGLGAAAAGATVGFDPDNPDFLKAKWGDKRYDFTGGLSQYIRTYLRITEAIYYRLNPNISKDKANKKGAFAAMSTQSFFRYKLAPNTGYTINAITGKDPLGKDFDPWEILYIYPMYIDDMRESYEKDGALTAGMAIVLPNLFGVGVQEYSNKKEPKSPEERKKAREEALRKYEQRNK